MLIILTCLLVVAVGRVLREVRRALASLPRSNRDWIFF